MSNQPSGHGNSELLFIMIIMTTVFIMSLVITSNFHYIAAIWKSIRLIELTMVSWIPSWVPILGGVEVSEGVKFLSSLDALSITPETIEDVDSYYAKYFAWIPSLLLFFIGFKLLKKTEEVGTVYDMESLLKRQSKYFPHAKDFVSVNPEKMDLRYQRATKEFHAYAMSISPEEFAKMSPPLGLEKEAKKDSSYRAPIWDGEAAYDIDLAERAFAKQLGRPFKGVAELKGVEKELYEYLTPKVPYGQKYAINLTIKLLKLAMQKIDKGRFSSEFPSEITLYKAISKKYSNTKIEKRKLPSFARDIVISKEFESYYKKIVSESVMSKHAFVRIGLMSLLSTAREGGIVAPVDMRNMIKPKDRALWYCVSSVGKKVSFVESAGCFSHWLVEKWVGRPLHKPEVTAAVNGLFKELKLDKEKEK